MSDLNDQSTRAVVRATAAIVRNFLDFFDTSDTNRGWGNWASAESITYLETLKGGLLNLALCVEQEIQEAYQETQPPTDFGTNNTDV